MEFSGEFSALCLLHSDQEHLEVDNLGRIHPGDGELSLE